MKVYKVNRYDSFYEECYSSTVVVAESEESALEIARKHGEAWETTNITKAFEVDLTKSGVIGYELNHL